MNTCLEMVKFKLADVADRKAFLAAAPEITKWASSQPGFQARTLVDAGEQGWVDMVWWSSESDAIAASARIRVEKTDSPFMSMIDRASVRTAHHRVAYMGMAA